MEDIQSLSFVKKQKILKTIFNEYQRAKVKLHCLELTDFYPEIQYDVVREKKSVYNPTNVSSILNSRIDNKQELYKMLQSFEYIISSLSPDSNLIITKEFIEKANRDWWREYYAKTTYYRLKTKAMEEMLFYLNI